MAEGVIVTDENGEYLLTNEAANEMLEGLDRRLPMEERSRAYGLFHPDGKTPIAPEDLPLRRALAGERIEDFRLFAQNEAMPEGRHIAVSGGPMSLDSTGRRGALLTFRDVTRNRRTEQDREEALQKLEDQTMLLNLVLDNMRDGVVVADEEGQVLVWNRSAMRITGTITQPWDYARARTARRATDSSRPGRMLPAPSEWAKRYGILLPDGKTPIPEEENPLLRALEGKAADNYRISVFNEGRPCRAQVSVFARPLPTPEGFLRAAVLVVHDLTEEEAIRADLEETVAELEHQTALTEAVFATMGAAVLVADIDGYVTKFNPLAEKLVGAGIPNVRLDEWSETIGVYSPDGSEFMPAEKLPLSRALRGEATDNVELLIRNDANPGDVMVNVSGRPLTVPGDRRHGAVSVFRDITKRKAAEAALKRNVADLRKQAELMEAVFDSITDGILVADRDGKLLYVNPGAQKITGLTTADGIPREEWGQLRSWPGGTPAEPYGSFHLDRETPLETSELPLVRALERGESVDKASVFIRNQARPEGAFVWVNGRPLLDDRGEIRGAVATLRDFTDEVLAEEAISKAFATGQKAMVEAILHNVGNAINSVTVGIDALHDRLNDDPLLERLSALASAVEENRHRWREYIGEDPQGKQVLPFIVALAEDFSKRNEELRHSTERTRQSAMHVADILRTRQLIGVTKSVSLDESLSNAVHVVRESLDRRGIRTEVDCVAAPAQIQVRESQFHQILVNLVKNSAEAIDALRATEPSMEAPLIRIVARADGDDLLLEVSDNGIGFEPEDAQALFSAGFSTKDSGSGLGLHSTARFVRTAGGSVEARSEGKGKGATISIRLPQGG